MHEDSDDVNDFVPSILNPRKFKKENENFILTQISFKSRCSLSLNRNKILTHQTTSKKLVNNQDANNLIKKNISLPSTIQLGAGQDIENASTILAIDDFITRTDDFALNSPDYIFFENINKSKAAEYLEKSYLTESSHTNLNDVILNSATAISSVKEQPIFSVVFGVIDCDNINISTKNINIRNIKVAYENDKLNVDCDLMESAQTLMETDMSNMEKKLFSPPTKRPNVAVNLEIKKKKLKTTENCIEESKVLILNSNAIEKISHVIVQPPNYKIVKKPNFLRSKIQDCTVKKSVDSSIKNGKTILNSANLKQKSIDTYLVKNDVVKVTNVRTLSNSNDIIGNDRGVVHNDVVDMSKTGAEGIKLETVGKTCGYKNNWKETESSSPKSARISGRKLVISPKSQDVKTSKSEAPHAVSPKGKANNSAISSPKKKLESIQFNLSTKSKSIKTSAITKNIPYFKIVAGTQFAVDAFSYGDIPNVKHYFLTHFHSDHYSGLKKSFNKILYCSNITAELCITRLGVNPKCIHEMTLNQTIVVEAVEVTAVDANHCPGAIMLVFTLPNRKSILHTGDFRASPIMESYPVFWNKDIHTIYLDTTYCNPRYDFPSQDQSLEMALQILRQKKLALLKTGKKFSSVLIVCGTYTIGKEKFFMGMSRRVRCAVWACPEKERVLRAVRGAGVGAASPRACQLHVVPMRDLTHEKLRSYLDSLEGAFSEVVAFKPSGWENGKNAPIEKDQVTIHGIPYSEHSSFSEIIRFVKYLKPKHVVPTVDIAGGIKAVQKYFPCPLVCKEDIQCQSKMTEFFSIQNRQQASAVT